MNVDKVFTLVDFELRVLLQRFDVDWHSVSVEEGAEVTASHGWCVIAAAPGDRMCCLACPLLHGAVEGEGGLWNSNAPHLSK